MSTDVHRRITQIGRAWTAGARSVADWSHRTPAARAARRIESHRRAGDDGERQGRAFATYAITQSLSGLPAALGVPELADYSISEETRRALGNLDCEAIAKRFADAWATSTATLTDGVTPLPALNFDDPWSVPAWQEAAEAALYDALAPTPPADATDRDDLAVSLGVDAVVHVVVPPHAVVAR